jgi:hypothetical protein
MRATRHPWYSPSAWLSSLLFELAMRSPNDIDMMLAAAFGVVEICGLKRASKPILRAVAHWFRARMNAR